MKEYCLQFDAANKDCRAQQFWMPAIFQHTFLEPLIAAIETLLSTLADYPASALYLLQLHKSHKEAHVACEKHDVCQKIAEYTNTAGRRAYCAMATDKESKKKRLNTWFALQHSLSPLLWACEGGNFRDFAQTSKSIEPGEGLSVSAAKQRLVYELVDDLLTATIAALTQCPHYRKMPTKFLVPSLEDPENTSTLLTKQLEQLNTNHRKEEKQKKAKVPAKTRIGDTSAKNSLLTRLYAVPQDLQLKKKRKPKIPLQRNAIA